MLNEQKYLFLRKYSQKKMIYLKKQLLKFINLKKHSKFKKNIITICKSCFLKIIEFKQIIKYMTKIFQKMNNVYI